MLKEERIVLILLASLNFTHILDFMILMPLGNYLMPHFHLSAQQFTILVSAYAFSAGTSSFLSAFFVNDFDRKKVLIFAYIGFLIGTVACGISPSYEILLVSRTLAGFFGGMIGAQVISIVADLIPYERRGVAMGIVMAAFALASIVGVPFALYLSNMISWHAPFILIGTLGFLLLPFLFRYIPKMDFHIKSIKSHPRLHVFRQLISSESQLLALLFSCLMFTGHFMIIPFINPFLEFNMGFEKSFAPLVYLCGGICSLFAAQLIGKLADKYGKWLVYRICVVLSFPLIYTITNLPTTNITLVLILFSLWFIVATGRGVSAQALVSNVSDPEFRGSFQSFNSFMQQMGTGLASIIAGFVVTNQIGKGLTGYPNLGIISIIALSLTIIVGNKVFKN